MPVPLRVSVRVAFNKTEYGEEVWIRPRIVETFMLIYF